MEKLGAKNVKKLNRAVECEGDLEFMYRANYCSYFAIRVLCPIFEFEANSEEEYYDEIKKYSWEGLFTILDTFSIRTVVSSEVFTHSQFMALKAKDAIADRFVERSGKRPSVDIEDPTFMINIQIARTTCRVSIDCSGDSLHKRGYRIETGPAPINEVLAAGIVKMSEWDQKSPFIDPMCGSGTFLVEAALQASHTPPGKYRKHYHFMNFNNFDRRLWVKIKNEVSKKIRRDIPPIYGFDASDAFIDVAETNVVNAKMDEYVHLKKEDFFLNVIEDKTAHVVFNPPYGERMHKHGVEHFYESIGSKLKRDFIDMSVWLISSNVEAINSIGLKSSRKISLLNGKLESKLLNYKMYKGSKKEEY